MTMYSGSRKGSLMPLCPLLYGGSRSRVTSKSISCRENLGENLLSASVVQYLLVIVPKIGLPVPAW
jgi:hypothetical protein